MITTDITPVRVTIAYVLHSAALSFGRSRDEIMHQHQSYPINCEEHVLEGAKRYAIEIVFENLQTDLMCLFDEGLRCYGVVVFPNNEDSMQKYIDFLTMNYRYNHLKCWWELPGCMVGLRNMEGEVCLCFEG